MRLLYLVLGGAAGTVSRHALSGLIHENVGQGFPYGTLGVNVLGCLIIGFLSSIGEGRLMHDENMRVLLAVGFCGAFTTFSTLILEVSNLLKSGGSLRALLYVGVSVFAGIAAFVAGHRLGEFL